MTTTEADSTVMAEHGARSDPELSDLRALVDLELVGAFHVDDPSVDALARAIDYSLLGSGKRVRPVLCMAAAEACGADPAAIVPVAAAFEMVHAYSLVHDDLPAMDDDDLRRGVATSHRVYGEAVAILVGDALQARAFELVARADGIDPTARIEIVAVLARSAGWSGMVGGQFLDIDEERVDGRDLAALRDVHDRKTGALIAGAVESGAIAAGASDADRVHFSTFGRELGWLFQLVDDLLDATGSAERLGKTPGKDARSGKVTAIDVFDGVSGLRAAADSQLDACDALAAMLPGRGGRLGQIAAYVHGRDH